MAPVAAIMTDAGPAIATRVLVLGLGKTGWSCVRYLTGEGCAVTVADSRAEPPMLAELRRSSPGVAVHTGELDAALLEGQDMVVVSPGLSPQESILRQARACGTEIVGDIELFARATPAPVIAITGSNGKSTVTALAGELLRSSGHRVLVGGNIGTPALDLLAEPTPEAYVLELSSFQLETTTSLACIVASVLNVSPDHMDRYRDVSAYADAKARILRGAGATVLNRDDALVMAMAPRSAAVRTFGRGEPAGPREYGLRRHGGALWLARGRTPLVEAGSLRLLGDHNALNALAALAIAESFGAEADAAMLEALCAFAGLPHRAELVAEIAGVRWINDSKGTNVGATVAAVKGGSAPLVLIAGGIGKGADFTPLREALAPRARLVILIGRDAPTIAAALGPDIPQIHSADLRDAVSLAAQYAEPGDDVLLSPACASFDMFADFEHRGREFRRLVQQRSRQG